MPPYDMVCLTARGRLVISQWAIQKLTSVLYLFDTHPVCCQDSRVIPFHMTQVEQKKGYTLT